MNESKTMIGRCRCGEIQFEVTAPPMMTMVCHCKGCQRMSASAFSASAAYPNDAFRVTQGTPVPGGARTPGLDHSFCPSCKSWLFTRFMPEFVNVRVMQLDDAAWFVPFIETWTSNRLPWARTPAVHRFEEFPPMERFPELLAEFASRGR